MSIESHLLSSWPVPIRDDPVYDSSSHRCRYCDPLSVSFGPDTKVSRGNTEKSWTLVSKVPYTYQTIRHAASARCMFFVWVLAQLERDVVDPSAPPEETPYEDIDDGEELQGHDSWFVFRFHIADRTSKPFARYLTPAEISNVYVVFRTRDRSWPHWVFSNRDAASNIALGSSPEVSVGKHLIGNASSPPILLQVRERLADCIQNHPKCHARNNCNVRPTRFLNINPVTSVKTIRLQQLNIDSRRPYVTLSYVWGQSPVTKTTLATRVRHELGIQADSLPGTIRDAIQITRLLGIDLLWIDSLCIVQDDPDELAGEIANMAFYYGNSLLTLSAASARSCDEGIFANESSGERLDWIQFDLPFNGSHLVLQSATGSRYAIDERAWTLQETMLSKRLVTIGSQVTSWSCPTAQYGEVRFRDLLRELGNFRHASMEMSTMLRKEFQLRYDSNDGLGSIQKILSSPQLVERRYLVSGDEGAIEYGLFLWFDIVKEYTRRSLSDGGDILNAISGIAQELSIGFPDNWCDLDAPKYLAGLWWSRYLPLQLLWRALARFERNPAYTAPSWSWASAQTPLSLVQPTLTLTQRAFKHVDITSCYVQRQSPKAPYGAVTAGHLEIRGRVFQLTCSNAHFIDEYGINLYGDSGEISKLTLESTVKGLTLLEILSEDSVDDDDEGTEVLSERGLILEQVVDGTYKRVGIFGHTLDNTDEVGWQRLFRMPWGTDVVKVV